MTRIFFLLFTVPAFIAAGADYQQRYEELAENRVLGDVERLHRLFDLDWERGLHNNPEFATSIGYPGLDHLWTDVSQAAIERRKAELQWPLAVVKSIDRTK